jgi:hypothetical protein
MTLPLMLNLAYCASRRDGHFELIMRSAPYVVLVRRYKKLIQERPYPAPDLGVFGDYSHEWGYVSETPKRYILAPDRVDWYIICGG